MSAHDTRTDPLDDMLVAARQHGEAVLYTPPGSFELIHVPVGEEADDVYRAVIADCEAEIARRIAGTS